MQFIKKHYKEMIIALLAIAVISLTIALIVPPIQRAVNRANNYGVYDVVKQNKMDNFDLQNKNLEETIEKSVAEDEERLVFFGDSITEIAPINDMYPYKSADYAKVYNRGISGDTVKSMRGRISNVVNLKPTTLIILIGVNDLTYGGSIDEITGYLGEVIDKLVADSSKNNYKMEIIIQSVLPVNETGTDKFTGLKKNTQIKELNVSYKTLCDGKPVSFIDTYSDFIDKNGDLRAEYTYDGLHPTAIGYYKMREVLEEKLFKLRKI